VKNIIYQAVSKITEEREANRSYHGNGHHLAQEITEAVEAALKLAEGKKPPTKAEAEAAQYSAQKTNGAEPTEITPWPCRFSDSSACAAKKCSDSNCDIYEPA